DAVASASPVAAAYGVHLRAADRDWPTVRGSEPELSRIVANLLRNAIRHTPADGTVTVTGGRDADGGWVAVSDACGGIPEGDLSRVFDVAFRGEAARTPRESGGGGLGLAIVRGLVDAHRGAGEDRLRVAGHVDDRTADRRVPAGLRPGREPGTLDHDHGAAVGGVDPPCRRGIQHRAAAHRAVRVGEVHVDGTVVVVRLRAL